MCPIAKGTSKVQVLTATAGAAPASSGSQIAVAPQLWKQLGLQEIFAQFVSPAIGKAMADAAAARADAVTATQQQTENGTAPTTSQRGACESQERGADQAD